MSFGPLAFPRIAHYVTADRGLVQVRAQGQSVLVLFDVLSVARGRAELTLILAAPVAARP